MTSSAARAVGTVSAADATAPTSTRASRPTRDVHMRPACAMRLTGQRGAIRPLVANNRRHHRRVPPHAAAPGPSGFRGVVDTDRGRVRLWAACSAGEAAAGGREVADRGAGGGAAHALSAIDVVPAVPPCNVTPPPPVAIPG